MCKTKCVELAASTSCEHFMQRRCHACASQ
jgi:hypothetical protein